jgi:hypothetical protein
MSAPAPRDDSGFILPLDVLEDAAEALARGGSWDDVAAEAQWGVRELKRAAREDPRFWPLVETIKSEDRDRAAGEMLRAARASFRSEDGQERAKAIDCVAKYLASIHRDETRLKVAELNNQTKLAVERLRAAAKGAKAEDSQAEEEPQMPPMTPEQEEHLWECQRRAAAYSAEQVAREKGVMYLWGGCHKLGETLPDHTDTPLQVFTDHTTARPDKPLVIWAVPVPPPVADPINGPFLAPPGCRPPTCPAMAEENTVAG